MLPSGGGKLLLREKGTLGQIFLLSLEHFVPTVIVLTVIYIGIHLLAR